MAVLDTVLKVVRISSAVVWLGVGIFTLWVTWRVYQDLQPVLQTLNRTVAPFSAPPSGSRTPSGGLDIGALDLLLRATSTVGGSR